MQHVPTQLSNDLLRLRGDSRTAIPTGCTVESAADIEELVAKAIHLYDRLNRRHERWANPIRQGRAPFDLKEGKLWQTTFQDWCDDARQIIQQAKTVEAQGGSIDQLDLLRSTLQHCDYDGADIENLLANAAALERGQGIPLSEITHELQRRLGPNGQG